MKTALICGVSGQDGAYLARLLVEKGYRVIGTSRDAESAHFNALERVGVRNQVEVESMTLTDFRSVLQIVTKQEPNEIYNLAGQSSVGLSFLQPVETLESITIGVLNLLECIRLLGREIKLYNAGSSECFGDTMGEAASEETPFRPLSPYATAKAAAYWTIANYRSAYDIFACTGLLFNHESPLRPARFVTRKIVMAACDIYRGRRQALELGNLGVVRDWGWAPEYVKAMWQMMQLDTPEDFVIATGRSFTLEEFCSSAFAMLNLNYQDYVKVNSSLLRPSDIKYGRGNPAKAFQRLGWIAQTDMRGVVRRMVEAELEHVSEGGRHQILSS